MEGIASFSDQARIRGAASAYISVSEKVPITIISKFMLQISNTVFTAL